MNRNIKVIRDNLSSLSEEEYQQYLKNIPILVKKIVALTALAMDLGIIWEDFEALCADSWREGKSWNYPK